MQVTGGYLKGRKLLSPPKNSKIRPLRTRIRKALFDILGSQIKGTNVLDLFSGTGALGIEALSREANFCVFVDYSPLSLNLIKKNLENLNLIEKTKIFKLKLPEGFSKLTKNYSNFFDIVFITPPYATGLSLETLRYLPICLLKEKAIIMVEERTNIKLPEKIKNFELLKKRIYGETTLYFYYRQ